jgi:AcrR family transcriptional regulator
MPAEGRRERKKRQTRATIVAAAFTLFAERGFEAVTVSEIAGAADVARATLFSYFHTKDAIVLDVVGDEDPAEIVAGRPAATSPLDALRAYYLVFVSASASAAAAEAEADAEPSQTVTPPDAAGAPDLLTCVRVITDSPTLLAAVNRLRDSQQTALAAQLARSAGVGDGDLAPALAAAQISAVIGALKSRFFARLAAGDAFETAVQELPQEVELAFDLLERGLGETLATIPHVERAAS